MQVRMDEQDATICRLKGEAAIMAQELEQLKTTIEYVGRNRKCEGCGGSLA